MFIDLLPDDVLRYIFRFAGSNSKDLLNLLLVSKRFNANMKRLFDLKRDEWIKLVTENNIDEIITTKDPELVKQKSSIILWKIKDNYLDVLTLQFAYVELLKKREHKLYTSIIKSGLLLDKYFLKYCIKITNQFGMSPFNSHERWFYNNIDLNQIKKNGYIRAMHGQTICHSSIRARSTKSYEVINMHIAQGTYLLEDNFGRNILDYMAIYWRSRRLDYENIKLSQELQEKLDAKKNDIINGLREGNLETVLIPIFRLNETFDFKSEDASSTNMYMSTAEPCKNRLDQLKMKFGITHGYQQDYITLRALLELHDENKIEEKYSEKFFEYYNEIFPETIDENDIRKLNWIDDKGNIVSQNIIVAILLKKPGKDLDYLKNKIIPHIDLNLTSSSGETVFTYLFNDIVQTYNPNRRRALKDNKSLVDDIDHLLKIAKILIDAGADINHTTTNNNYQNILYHAVSINLDITIIKFLIENGANTNNLYNYEGPIIITAIAYNNLEAVEFLINSGIDLNLRKSKNETEKEHLLQKVAFIHRDKITESKINSWIKENVPDDYKSGVVQPKSPAMSL